MSFEYAFNTEHKKQLYLDAIKSNSRSDQQISYEKARRGQGLRIETLQFNGCTEMGVSYYKALDEKTEKRWKSGKERPPLEIDRVRQLLLPDPETGELTPFAEFKYEHGTTEVLKTDGSRTVYHYRNKFRLIDQIEYFDTSGNRHLEVLYNWEEGIRLKEKILKDGAGNQILSKRMEYDSRGNLIREALNDYLHSKQSIALTFSYYEESNLIQEEVGPNGVTIRYWYLPGTDLVQLKETTALNGDLLYREATTYDEDHLPIQVALEDGVSERHIQCFERDPQTGKVQKLVNLSTNIDLGIDQWFSTHSFTYNEQGKVNSKTVTYPDESSYTLYFDYDTRGNLIRETTPSGRESTYKYDELGRKTEEKKVGQPKQIYTYDKAGHLRTTTIGQKTSSTYYDQKGCLYSFTDPNGNQINQEYNNFGKCIKTHYPQNVDSNGEVYTPYIETAYDEIGNITSTFNPLGNTKNCTYDVFGNVVTELNPGGFETKYSYDLSGSLISIHHPDQSITMYTYDPLQRKTSEKRFKYDGELLSEEYWSYDSFHLLEYTNPMGLTTSYRYDCFGRKIEENAEGRITSYEYNTQGNLQSVTQNGATSYTVNNNEGEILEQWEEDQTGKIENWMSFTYDEEGRKTTAIRQTSKGEAVDSFEYDEEGRLISHRDPLGAITAIQYETAENALGQIVEQKRIVDPLGNQTVELKDANGHLVLIEKTNPNGVTVAKEQRAYDRGGNLASRIVSVYDQKHPIRTYQTQWQYNKRGLPIKEIEEGIKTTLLEYDSMGNLSQKTNPNGVILQQSFDPLGRLKEQQSSDGSIHYTFHYQNGGRTVIAEDQLTGCTWIRTYNQFSELTTEKTPHGAVQTWTYDNAGRCTQHTLPDDSSIAYTPLHMDQEVRQDKHRQTLYQHTYSHFDENGHVAQEESIFSLGTLSANHDLLERAESLSTPWHRASVTYRPFRVDHAARQ